MRRREGIDATIKDRQVIWMGILIDFGHPAHVHLYRNLIKILCKKVVEFLTIARNKDVTITPQSVRHPIHICRKAQEGKNWSIQGVGCEGYPDL